MTKSAAPAAKPATPAKTAAAPKHDFRAQTTLTRPTYAALAYRAEQAVPPVSFAAIVRYALDDFAKRNPAPADYNPPAQDA